MPRSYGRNERVAAAVRRELADVLQNELHDPRVKNATITEVDVSPDLRNARVYISFLTDKKEEIDAAMRYMPDLDLRYDSLLTESMKLDALIAKGLNKK